MNSSTGPNRFATIEPYIHRKLLYVSQDTPIHQVARILCDSGAGSCLFHDNQGRLTGILTDRDVTCDVLAQQESAALPAARFMKTRLITLEEHSLVSDAIEKMEQYGVRRIPVIRSREGKTEETGAPSRRVVGVLSLDDLLAAGAIEPRPLAKIIQRQLHISPFEQGGRTVRYVQSRDGAFHPISTRNTIEGPKTQAHVDQTFARFLKVISKDSGIPLEGTADFSTQVLTSLLRRIPWSAATHFMAQLPRKLQMELYKIPAGPDRNMTPEVLISKISRLLNCTDAESDRILYRYLKALGNFVSIDALYQLKSQLPSEFREYFPVEKEEFEKEPEGILLPPQSESMEPASEGEPVRAGHPDEGERSPSIRTAS